MGLFNRRGNDRSEEQPLRRPLNLLPSDNVYLAAAQGCDEDFTARGWPLRVGGVRMQFPGELEIALVVMGVESGGMREALDALPGPAPVAELLGERLQMFGHSVNSVYVPEYEWAETAESPLWAYCD